MLHTVRTHTQLRLSPWLTAFCFGSGAHHTCAVMSSILSSVLYELWCHLSAPCPMIRSREMWGHSGFPKRNINHNDFQKSKVQSKAGAAFRADQHLPNTWIRKVMSLPFWFNHSVGLILPQCDILITMISTSGTYVQHLLSSGFVGAKLSEQSISHIHYKVSHLALVLILCAQVLRYPTKIQRRWMDVYNTEKLN